MEVKTEEEHLAIITKKLHAKFFKPDGTPNYFYEYYDKPDKTDYTTWNRITVLIESFDVEILLSFDNKPEHFLITHKPSIIGYTIGTIIDNKYYIVGSQSNSNNPFEEKGIEKGNRYYMQMGASGDKSLAYKKDRAFVDLYTGYIFTEAEIKERLQFLRSRYGIRFIKGQASLL